MIEKVLREFEQNVQSIEIVVGPYKFFIKNFFSYLNTNKIVDTKFTDYAIIDSQTGLFKW